MIAETGTKRGDYCGPAEPRRTTAAQKADAVALARKGMTLAAIAERYGVHANTVKRWCRNARLEHAREEEPDMLHEFPAWVRARMAERGWTQRELQDASGVRQGSISRLVRGAGGMTMESAVRIIDALTDHAPEAVDDPERTALEALTMGELRELARGEGISLGYDGSTKETAVARILRVRRGEDAVRQTPWCGSWKKTGKAVGA